MAGEIRFAPTAFGELIPGDWFITLGGCLFIVKAIDTTHCDDCDWTFTCWQGSDTCREKPAPTITHSGPPIDRARVLALLRLARAGVPIGDCVSDYCVELAALIALLEGEA